MKNKNISDLDIIDNAIDDAKFVLNDSIPYKGIRKVFIYWIYYLLVINLFLYVSISKYSPELSVIRNLLSFITSPR